MDRLSTTAPILEAEGEVNIALCSVRITATLKNLLSEITICQTYRNLEPFSINTFYTFSLPPSAHILDFNIKIGNLKLKGVVYALTDPSIQAPQELSNNGHLIPIEQIEPGIFRLASGNLFPDEEIQFSLSYAELLKLEDNMLQWIMPTRHPSIYRDVRNIESSFSPSHLFLNEPFHMTLAISGSMALNPVVSPSHLIDQIISEKKRVVSIKSCDPIMDKDIVLQIPLVSDKKDFALIAKGNDTYISLVSFHPEIPSRFPVLPRCITIMIDCSGSMQGETITQAKRALIGILSRLRSKDYFNVILFGSFFIPLFEYPVIADLTNIQKAGELLNTISANMGETKIEAVISFVVNAKKPWMRSRDVLLITDGGIWEWESVVRLAMQSGIRFFTVGVGSAVSESFVRILAEKTGGVAELVHPNEGMAEKIIRHFRRIYLPRAGNIRISWSHRPEKMIPSKIGTIFDQNTLHLFFQFKEIPKGEIRLSAIIENKEYYSKKIPLERIEDEKWERKTADTLERIAASYEIISLEKPEDIISIALCNQLITPYTGFAAIDQKNIFKRNMAPDSVTKTVFAPISEATNVNMDGFDPKEDRYSDIPISHVEITEMENIILPQRILVDEWLPPQISEPFQTPSANDSSAMLDEFITENLEDRQGKKGGHFIDSLDMQHAGLIRISLAVSTIKDMEFHGAPQSVINELRTVISSGTEEKTAIIAFLYHLSQKERVRKEMSESLVTFISKAYKAIEPHSLSVNHGIHKAVSHFIKEL